MGSEARSAKRGRQRALLALSAAAFSAASCLSGGRLSILEPPPTESGGSAGDAGLGGDGGDDPGVELLPCAPTPSGLAFEPCTVSYLGGLGNEEIVAAAALSEEDFVLAGVLSGEAVERTGASGPVRLVKIEGRGRVATRSYVDPLPVVGLEARPGTAELFALTATRVLRLDGATLERVGEVPVVGAATRLAVSEDHLAVLTNVGGAPRLLLFGTAGELLLEQQLDFVEALDVALDESLGLVFVGGATSGGACSEVPVLRAYEFDGRLRWSAWSEGPVRAAELDLCAGSRVVRVVTRGGEVAIAGRTIGGNSVFGRDPSDLSRPVDLAGPEDDYGRTFNVGPTHFSFVAKLDAPTGAALRASFLVGRRRDTPVPEGATFDPLDLTLDGRGRLHLLARAAGCCAPDRDRRTVAGRLLGPPPEEEIQLVALSSDFAERLHWTSFTGEGAAGVESRAGAIAAYGDSVVGSFLQVGPGAALTFQALQRERVDAPEPLFFVYRMPSEL